MREIIRVSHENKTAVVACDREIDRDTIIDVIRRAGYRVIEHE